MSINPSGTHVVAIATAAAIQYWINIYQTSDGALIKSVAANFDTDIPLISEKNLFMDS